MAQLEKNLAEVKQQTEQTEKRFHEITRDMDEPRPPDSSPAATTGGDQKLSSSLKNSLQAPPGGNPEVTASITRLKKQVESSPSLGKVINYDRDWGLVTFGAGSKHGVKVGQRFAVRRGSDILGWVKVDEVHETMSIAHMVTKNAKSDMSLKPQVGDDLIQFEL